MPTKCFRSHRPTKNAFEMGLPITYTRFWARRGDTIFRGSTGMWDDETEKDNEAERAADNPPTPACRSGPNVEIAPDSGTPPLWLGRSAPAEQEFTCRYCRTARGRFPGRPSKSAGRLGCDFERLTGYMAEAVEAPSAPGPCSRKASAHRRNRC